jgi:hypothetical protein
MDEKALKARIDALLELAKPVQGVDWHVVAHELFQGTVTVLEAVYGPQSTHARAFQDAFERAGGGVHTDLYFATRAAQGVLQNLKAEVEAGLLGNLRQQMAGDVLTDFVALARTALDRAGDGAKNVAAVLSAAAFEDTIRRMGRELAGVMGRDDLDDVIGALKRAGILQAPQLGIAVSYLKFRNDALHADWAKIDRAAVHSVLGFVEQLLLKHFS